MHCPTCGNILTKIEVTTSQGGRFDVDHCGKCGGTWFDPYEINRIPHYEVMRLSRITVPSYRPLTTLPTRLCPKCHKQMEKYHLDTMPAGLMFLKCSECNGLWTTQKELEQFKKYQKKTVKNYIKSGIAFPSLSLVFLPALFVLLLLLSTGAVILNLEQSKQQRVKADESIVNLQTRNITSSTIHLSFQTKSKVKSTISLGPSSLESKIITINNTLSKNHQLLITMLKPNTLYIYRLILEDENGRQFTTSDDSFTTLP